MLFFFRRISHPHSPSAHLKLQAQLLLLTRQQQNPLDVLRDFLLLDPQGEFGSRILQQQIYCTNIDYLQCYALNRPPSEVTEPPTTAAAEETTVDRAVTSSSIVKKTLTTSLVGFAAAVWFLVM